MASFLKRLGKETSPAEKETEPKVGNSSYTPVRPTVAVALNNAAALRIITCPAFTS
jgi:hypothetical protein